MSNKNPLICILSVDFDEDKTSSLNIRYDDNPLILADSFIMDNGLDSTDESLRSSLSSHINANYLEARTRYDQQLAERVKTRASVPPPSPPPPVEPSVPHPHPHPPVEPSISSVPPSSTFQPPPPPPIITSPSKSGIVSPNRSIFSVMSSDIGHRAMVGSEEELERRYEAIAQSVASIAHIATSNPSSTGNSRNNSNLPRSSIGSHVSRKSTVSSVQVSTKPKILLRPTSISSEKVSTSSQSITNSALYDRLHKEAEEKAKRSEDLTAHVRKLERESYLEQRRKFGYKPQTASELSNKPRVEDRLYEFAKEDALRKEQSLSVQRAALAAKTDGAWICPTCGITNSASLLLCENPLKFGSVVLASNRRVCGGIRPNSEHIPTISHYAHQISRVSSVPHLPSAATIGVEQYRKDRLAREELGKAKVEAEVSAQSFKPTVSQRSSELADIARHRRLKALAEAQAAQPRVHATITSSDSTSVDRLAELSSHDLLYEDAIFRQRVSSESTADEIISRSGVAKSEAELEEFFTRMHAHAAETRARIEASRQRLTEQELKAIESTRPRENKQTGQVTSSLFDHIAARKRNKDAVVQAAHEEAERMSRSRHTLRHSESLLEKRRELCFAGVFNALVNSMQLSPDARAEEFAAQFAFERTIGGALGSAGPKSIEAGFVQPKENILMSREDLAASLVALRIYSIEEGDNQIDEAHSNVLDLDAVWSTCLVQPQLVKLVDTALSRLRIQASMKQQQAHNFVDFKVSTSNVESEYESSPRLAKFPEFCSCLGRILEEVGGGPQVYVLARRLTKKRDEVQACIPAVIVEKVSSVSVESAVSAGERLHAKSSEYSRGRIYREIDKLRSEFEPTGTFAQPSISENNKDTSDALRLLRKFSEQQQQQQQQQSITNTKYNNDEQPGLWLPKSVALEAARNTEAVARQMGLHGMNFYAISAANSRQGSPSTSNSALPQPQISHPFFTSPQKNDISTNVLGVSIGSPKSSVSTQPSISNEGNVSRLSANSGAGGAFVMSPQQPYQQSYQHIDDYGYANSSSIESLIHESGELNKSLAKLSSISIQALNDRIERILRSPIKQ